jgi:twinkle protein
MSTEKSKPTSVLQPCPCGKSSDACSYWDAGGWYCHSCNKKGHLDKVSKTPAERGISDATLKYFNIHQSGTGHLSFTYKALDDSEDPGYKNRAPDKTFCWGNKPSKVKLFGQDLFSSGGKFLTITEGELDACYAFEAMGSKFPVVSVDSAGAAPGNCKDNYDWINSFETIVLAFDNDKPGQSAAAKVADLFPGKTKIVKFKQGCKDPCDYGPSGKAEFVQNWWRAEVPKVEGLIPSSQLIDAVISTPRPKCYDYPWAGLNDITAGWRLGELVMIGAGTGIGKTLFMTHVADHVMKTTDFNIGVLFLEDPNIDAARRFVAVRGRVPYHLPKTVYDEQEFRDTANEVLGKDRICFYNNDQFAANSKDEVLSKIKQMIRVHNCKIFFLDHITFITSASAEGDERRSIDEMMTEIKALTVNEGVNIHAVSHFKRLSGTSHENGAAGSINDFRGSGAIAQLANVALSLERNGQAVEPIERNTTTIRVLKNRLSGKTGEACKLIYNEWPFTWDAVETDEDS